MGELFCEGLQLLEEQSEYAGSDSDVVREKKEGSPSCHSDSRYSIFSVGKRKGEGCSWDLNQGC